MKIQTSKELLPVTIGKLKDIKFISDYKMEGYNYKGYRFSLPSSEIRGYLDTDFVFTFGANVIANNLMKTLADKQPPI